MTLPKPGLHENVSFDDYLAWDAVSSSQLSLFARSPAHYKAGYKAASKQMKLGSVVHCCVLEDGLVGRYSVVPSYHLEEGNVDKKKKPSKSKATDWYKKKVAEFAHGLPPEVEICSQETYDKAKGVYDAIKSHEIASKLLADGKCEVSLLWMSGDMACKGRVDLLAGDYFVDLKTTSSCESFPASISRYNYHRQMAWYRHGLKMITGEEFDPYIICCETDPPFGVMAAPMSEVALIEGIADCEALLEGIADCQFTGEWPGYESPEQWVLPE